MNHKEHTQAFFGDAHEAYMKALLAAHDFAQADKALPGTDVIKHLASRSDELMKAWFSRVDAARDAQT